MQDEENQSLITKIWISTAQQFQEWMANPAQVSVQVPNDAPTFFILSGKGVALWLEHTDDSTHEVFHYPYLISWLQPGKLLSRSSTREQGAALWTHLSVTWESTAGTTVWKSNVFQLPFLRVSVSHFWLQTGSKGHHNPPVPRSHQTHPVGCAWTHSSASSTALGKGSKACLASSLSTAEQ